VDALRVDFDVARATVSLDATAAVRADARFRVRARSVLGEKYLEIVPQTRDAAPLANGAVVTIDAPQTEIDELVSELGPLVRAVDPAVIRAIADPIRADPDRPARMLADAEQTLLDLADASARLSSLLDEAEGALRAVRVAAETVPPLVARADTVVTRLDALIASVAPEEVDALLAEILAAVRDGRATIGRVDGISGGLQRLVDRAEAITEEDLLRYTRDEGVLIRFEPRRKLTSPRP
jgi:ABC-type transporter Mla subunit MlaD